MAEKLLSWGLLWGSSWTIRQVHTVRIIIGTSENEAHRHPEHNAVCHIFSTVNGYQRGSPFTWRFETKRPFKSKVWLAFCGFTLVRFLFTCKVCTANLLLRRKVFRQVVSLKLKLRNCLLANLPSIKSTLLTQYPVDIIHLWGLVQCSPA